MVLLMSRALLLCSCLSTNCHAHLQIDHVRAERNVLAEVHNPYVVRLFYSFQVRSLASEEGPCRGAASHACWQLLV